MNTFRSLVSIFCLACAVPVVATPDNDLFALDLQQLMNVKVISATKRSQTLSDTASAMHIISREDIRRAGATTLPELLRQAPGVEVARINASMWAITIRGFQSQFANKLLVMIDGRSVYTPLFSGVYWDAQMPVMEDIEQIEIIRGPGSSVWGANAVNGVINIITRHSADTQDVTVTGGAGNVESGFMRGHYGDAGEHSSYRVSGQYRGQDESIDAATGDDSDDAWHMRSVGLRTDLETASHDRITLQGDYLDINKHNSISLHPYVASQIPAFEQNIGSENANVLLRWQRPGEAGNQHTLQTYVDWSNRNESTYAYRQTTTDIDYQFNLRPFGIHRWTMGLNYRFYSDNFSGTYAFDLADTDQDFDQGNLFLQDELKLSTTVSTILGMKLESTDTADFEYQPTARLLWTPSRDLTFWSAVSRATATPSRAGQGITLRNSLPPESVARIEAAAPPGFEGLIYGSLSGSEAYESESVIAYELGYRHQIRPDLFVDATTYYNQYRNLRTFDPLPATLQLSIPTLSYTYIANYEFGNQAEAHSTGFELATHWNPIDQWQLKLSYSYFNLVVDPDPGHDGLGASELSDQSPLHQAMLRSQHDLGNRWELDWAVKYMDQLPDDDIESYTDMNIRLGYAVTPALDVALVGQDLFSSPRTEFQDTLQGPYRTEMARSVFLQATWQPN